jgi:hypothetical protein
MPNTACVDPSGIEREMVSPWAATFSSPLFPFADQAEPAHPISSAALHGRHHLVPSPLDFCCYHRALLFPCSSLDAATPPPDRQTPPAPVDSSSGGQFRAATPPAPFGSLPSPSNTPRQAVAVQTSPRAAQPRAPATGPPPASSFRRRGPNCCDSILSREIYVK